MAPVSIRFILGSVLALSVQIAGCGTNNLQTGTCVNTAESLEITRSVLLAFQACLGTTAECDASDEYQLWLAQSDDLLRWEIVPGWVPIGDRGVDLIQRASTLYLYSDDGNVRYLDLDQGTLSCRQSIEVLDANSTPILSRILSPSPILKSAGGRILLAFLDSTDGSEEDPTTCTTFPCERRILSAEETQSGLGARFNLMSGSRVALSLTSDNPTLSNPEWLDTGATNGFLFFVTRAEGVLDLFASTTVGATYTSIGQVLGHGTPASLIHDGENYWEFAATLDTESPQNRVIQIRTSDSLSGLPSATSTFTFEGIDYPELGGFPIQLKDPSVLMLD